MYNVRKGLWENDCQEWELDWNVSREGVWGGGGVSVGRNLLFILLAPSYATLPWGLGLGRLCSTEKWNELGSRRRTDHEMKASDDITSLVPCLAVKGTNLMISRGRKSDRWSWKDGEWVKCFFFTVAFHHRESRRGCPGRAARSEGDEPRRMFHIGRRQEEQMVGRVYNY